MARIASGGNARLTDQWSVNRCPSQRPKSIVVSPASGGTASAESAAASAESAAAAEAAAAEAAAARPSSAGPTAASPIAATAARSADKRDDKSDQPPDDCERDYGRGQPNNGAYDPSGNSGPHDAAEQALEKRVHQNERDEQHDDRLEIDSAMNAVDDHARPGRKQTFSLDQLHQRAGPGSDAAVEITGAEVRRYHVAHDPLRDCVGDRALEAAPDLDAQLAIVLGDDEDDAVVDARAADFPRVGDADRVLLDGLGRSRRQHQHRDLAAFSALELAKSPLEILLLRSGERAGEIGHARLERRHRDLGAGGGEAREENAGREEAEPASAHGGTTASPARRACRNRPSAAWRWPFRPRR